jgi:hypothetical protein
MKKLVILFASLLVLAAIGVAVRAALERDGSTAPSSPEQEKEKLELRTRAYLAELDGHRPAALAALRLLVSSNEAPDEDVTLIFWEPLAWDARSSGIDWDPEKAAFVGGYWLGRARAVTLVWESKANELVMLSSLARRPLAGPDGGAAPAWGPAFHDLRATDDASIRAFELMAQHARFRGRPVVPISLEGGEGGPFKVEYLDGWDSGCAHWSLGQLQVNPHDGLVEMTGHID